MTPAQADPSKHEPVAASEVEPQSTQGQESLAESLSRAYASSEQRLDFFSAVAHDLKGPLTTIKGHAQLLLRRARKGDTMSSAAVIADAEKIEATASRMAEMISETLDITKIELGRPLDLVPRGLDVVALVSTVVEAWREDGEARLHFTSEHESIIGVFDELRLKRVVKNLISNALLYSALESPVRVELRLVDGSIELTVRDEGVGIPDDQTGKVFDRFFRARNVPETSIGLGMGLAAVRQIAEQMGGIATVESIEGHGTTARVLLPVQEPGEYQI
jgi:signal transduction histidine kinase